MEDYSRILFPSCTVNGKYMHYVTHGERALKKLNLEDGIVEYMDDPIGYSLNKWRGIDGLIIKNNIFYLFGEDGKRILEYSLEKKTCRCFEINGNIYLYDNIAAYALYRNTLYVFLSFSNELIKIDLESGIIQHIKPLCLNENYIFDNNNSIALDKKIKMPRKLFVCGCQIENQMWVFAEKYVVMYDFISGLCKQYMLPSKIDRCLHAVYKEGIFYILSIGGSIYSWDIEQDIAKEIYVNEENYSCLYFFRIVVTDKNIWMLPCFGDDIYVIDLNNKEKKIYNSYPKDFVYYPIEGRSRYRGYCEDDENYYFAMHSSNYILIIEKETGKEKWLKPVQPDLEEKIVYCKKNNNFWNITELEFGINGYLKILEKGLEDIGLNDGKKCWKYIMERNKNHLDILKEMLFKFLKSNFGSFLLVQIKKKFI